MNRFCFILFLFASTVQAQTYPAFKDLPSQQAVDPLVGMDGTKITSAAEWNTKRKPELQHLFEYYMYGRKPDAVKVTAKILFEDKQVFGGKATLREVEISFPSESCPKSYLLMALPNKAQGPVPCFLGYNFTGNHSLLADKRIHLPTVWMLGSENKAQPNRATEEGRGKQVDTWNLEYIIDRGYAVATLYYGDIDPDRADQRLGVQKHLWKLKTPEDDDPASVMVWAWGSSRMLDYLETDKAIDAKKVALVGHSRLGKATIVAGAFDERFAVVIPHQAGCGGTAPSRTKNPKNESVERINKAFPHWFDTNFKQFGPDTSKLPFDQNCLMALCAPRPLLITNAIEDEWANPAGQFQMLKSAEPVYKLLKAGECASEKMPEVGKVIDSKLGYWIRPGKHSMIKDDWKIFCDFADKWLR